MIKNTQNQDTKEVEAESSHTQTSSLCRGGLPPVGREAPAARAAASDRPCNEEQDRRAKSSARGEEGDSRRAARPPDPGSQRLREQQQQRQGEPSPEGEGQKDLKHDQLFTRFEKVEAAPADPLPASAVRKHFTVGGIDAKKALAVTKQRLRHASAEGPRQNTVFQECRAFVQVSFQTAKGVLRRRYVSKKPLLAFQCYQQEGQDWKAHELGLFYAVFFHDVGHLDLEFYSKWFRHLRVPFEPLAGQQPTPPPPQEQAAEPEGLNRGDSDPTSSARPRRRIGS